MIFLFLPIVISGQEISLIEDGKTWNMELYPYLGGGSVDFPVTNYGYSFELNGDSLINNFLYKKVYYRYNWYYTTDPDGIIEPTGANLNNPAELIGAIREDSINKKIFYINWKTRECLNFELLNEEVLLYDFDIEIGDTVNYSFPTEMPYILINKSNYVLSNGDSSTLYQFQGGMQWVSGIGGIDLDQGLLGPLQYSQVGCVLNCVHTDSLYYYGNENMNCDIRPDLLVMTENLEPIKEVVDVTLFPIPTNGELNILVESESSYSYQIYDIQGIAVTPEKRSNQRKSIEDLSLLHNGLYLIVIRLENGSNFCSEFIKN